MLLLTRARTLMTMIAKTRMPSSPTPTITPIVVLDSASASEEEAVKVASVAVGGSSVVAAIPPISIHIIIG